ncbi:Gfo/Idh/MocA family protein [Novosphingobium malaysiense]|uniref:Oxidoreductase n=1 Tax=Novosphingobium malaysiense TaxID=1348853 RepID=A0A0B1ZI58_9SPHN|nr:Gfo/Idh/MocA family oxidoreductase [Novosphingobium malaysiense]KHK88973.1 oxidoreductase [Novosphingobium malaysiense]
MVLRVGIVSAGWGGYAHLPAWRAVPGVKVTAMCTSREETARAAAANFGVERPFWDAMALCADPDIDIVDLGTRPNLRLPWVIAALEAGKHVYNSSPHAPGWDGAKAIDAAWRKAGTVGVVDAFAEWIPAVRHQIDLVRGGYLGRPLGGTCHFNISLFNSPSKQFPYGWFADKSAGVSAIRNNGSHMLYVLTSMFGAVEELTAYDAQFLPEWRYPDGDVTRPETNDHCSVILRFASGMVMTMQVNWNMTNFSGWKIDVFGTEGRLDLRAPTYPYPNDAILRGAKRPADVGRLDLVPEMAGITPPDAYFDPPGVALDRNCPVPASFGMALAMQSMVNSIEDRSTANPDFGRALEIERILEAIRVSSEARQWVKLLEVV